MKPSNLALRVDEIEVCAEPAMDRLAPAVLMWDARDTNEAHVNPAPRARRRTSLAHRSVRPRDPGLAPFRVR